MTGENRPNPNDDALLNFLASDPAARRLYLDLDKAARANEAPYRPFHLTKTQRWAAVGGCVVFLSWGVNALIEGDNTPAPLSTVETPAVETSPSDQSTEPATRNKGVPISGKGGAPTFE